MPSHHQGAPHPASGHLLPIRCGEGIILWDDFPGVALASRKQHRADFRCDFCAFEFAAIREIRVSPVLFSAKQELRREIVPQNNSRRMGGQRPDEVRLDDVRAL